MIDKKTLRNQINDAIDLLQRRRALSYIQNILAEIPVPIIPLCESPQAPFRHVAMRHDVDDGLLNALMMAVIENRMGVRSTYFLLHPADGEGSHNYFGYIDGSRIVIDKKLIWAAQLMQEMGHEIGLHNDLVTLALTTGYPAAHFLEQILGIFQQCGIKIQGSASHGSGMCRPYDYVNYQIFKECTEVASWQEALPDVITFKNNVVPLQSLSMNDFGLSYESYSLKYDAYYSDSGNINRFSIHDVQVQDLPPNNKDLFCSALMDANVRIIQILLHPDHWDARISDCTPSHADSIASADAKYTENCLKIRKKLITQLPNIAAFDKDIFDQTPVYNASYARNRFHFEQSPEMIDFVRQFVYAQSQTAILEVGCGQGDFLDFCTSNVQAGIPIIGMDGAYAGIADAALKYPQHRWVASEITSFLEKISSSEYKAAGIPQKFSCIIDKTGLSLGSFEVAYPILRRLYELLLPGGCYLYTASSAFYHKKYNDPTQWPLHYMDILHKIFGNMETHDIQGAYLRRYTKTAAM